VYAPIHIDFNVTVAIDHDHGYPMIMAVFIFHHRPKMVVMGGFPPVPVSIMVVRCGYPLPRREPIKSF
jgi:hypothetical protein